MNSASIPPLAWLCLLLPLISVAPSLQADPVEDLVKQIRALYNSIEGAKLRSSKVVYEPEDEPLVLTCTNYFQGDSLVKVHLSFGGGDHGVSDEYFYYDQGRLFFIYASDGYWHFTGATLPNGESETVDGLAEHRLYLDGGGHVIRHLLKEVKSSNPDQLKSLLAKAENRPASNPERAARLLRHGYAANQIRTREDLERFVNSPE